MSTQVSTNIALQIKDKSDVKNIALYNQEDMTEVLAEAQFFDGSVKDDKKVMEHPREDGTSIVDHIIDDAKTANIKIIVDDYDKSSLDEIKELYANSTLLILKLKNEFYPNFIISSKPLKADPQHYDKTVYELGFKEVLVAKTQYIKMTVPQVKQKRNATTINTGHKYASAASDVKKTIKNNFRIPGKKP